MYRDVFIGGLPDRVGHIVGIQVDAHAVNYRRPEAGLFHHGGLHEWRHDIYHANPLAAPFDIQRLGERAHRELAGGIGCQVWHPVEGRGGTHVDHRSGLAFLQEGVSGQAHVDQAGHVDVDDLLVLLRADGLKGAHAQNTGTVEQHIDATVFGKLPAGMLTGNAVGHIQRPVPAVVQLSRQPRQGGFIDVGQAHPPALLVEAFGGGQADAAGGASDQDAFHAAGFQCWWIKRAQVISA